MGKDRRVMRGRSEWLEIMKRQAGSGLTRAQFCKEEGIALTSFDNWRSRFKKDRAGEFVQLPASAVATPQPFGGVEIEFSTGLILRIKG